MVSSTGCLAVQVRTQIQVLVQEVLAAIVPAPAVTTAAAPVPAPAVPVPARVEEDRTPTSGDVGNYEASKVAARKLWTPRELCYVRCLLQNGIS